LRDERPTPNGDRPASRRRRRGPERRRAAHAATFPLQLASGESVRIDRRSGRDRRLLGFLGRMRIFRGVSLAVVEAAFAECVRRRIAPHEVLLQPGGRNTALHLIVSGRLGVRFHAGAQTPDVVLDPGDFCGEMSIIDGAQPSAWVVAMTQTEVLDMPADVFWQQLAPVPGVVRNLLSVLAERMRRANESVVTAVEQKHLLARYRSELELAREIQASMLPKRFPLFPECTGFTCHAAMFPAREVGGDFFDAFLLDERRVFVAIGDACGKGVPAAMLMARTIALLRAEAHRGRDPGRILARVNDAITENNASSAFTSIFCGILDFVEGEFTYANAGHPPPLASWEGNEYGLLKVPRGAVAGAWRGLSYPVRRIRVRPRSTLIAFTDGVTDALDADGRDFGEARLLAAVNAMRGADTDQLVSGLCAAVRDFAAGAEVADDVTVLGLRYFG